MMNLTDKEEQEMIERAKGGDPKANYDMSLWALEQAVAEPEEERWNRLAAKCLVKAAEAGYEPAKERMNQLLAALHGEQAASEAPTQPEEEARPTDTSEEGFDWSQEPDERPAQERQPQEQPTAALRAIAVAGIAARAIGAGAKTVYGKGRELVGKVSARVAQSQAEDGDDDLDEADEEAGTEAEQAATTGSGAGASGARHAASKKFSLPDFSQWNDSQWKKMQKICIIVCVVLALLIAIMIVSGKKDDVQEEVAQIPAAATTVPATPEPTAEPVVYPDAAVRAEIEAAALDIYPGDEDYVEEETTATVSAGAGLNLRKGPGSSYSQVVLMSYNAELEVYAYKNGWALVRYQGSTWGWCSDDYIKVQ